MNKTIDYSLLIATIFISLFGAYMILSATYYFNIFDESNNPLISFISDFQKIILGFAVMIVGIFINMKFVKKMAPLLMIASMVFLVMTVVVGKSINGSSRWLFIGSFSFAPSELAKVAAVLYFAKFIENMHKSEKHYQKAWLSVLIFGGFSAGIILVQKDLSTGVIYCAGIAGMLLVGGSKLRHMLLVTLIVLMIAAMSIVSKGYRIDRIKTFFEPTSSDVTTASAQLNQSLMAIAEGEVIGVGPGKAYQSKYGLSYSNSDFMFATVAETTGFLGALVVIGTYVFMLWRMARIAILSQSKYGLLVTTGIMSMIGTQALMHLMVNVKLMPITGVTLPLVSSGGTSTIVLLGAIGLVLNLSSNPKSLIEN